MKRRISETLVKIGIAIRSHISLPGLGCDSVDLGRARSDEWCECVARAAGRKKRVSAPSSASGSASSSALASGSSSASGSVSKSECGDPESRSGEFFFITLIFKEV